MEATAAHIVCQAIVDARSDKETFFCVAYLVEHSV